MKVSTIIPTFNRAYILADAVQSALTQGHDDQEIFVVDDGSSDETRSVVDRFSDNRIHYMRHERNRGCSAAYNTGISAATGEFIAILDSDDVWKPGYLNRQLELFDRHPEVDLAFSNTEICQGSGSNPTLVSLLRVFPRLLRNDPNTSERLFSKREMYLCLLEEVPVKPSAMVVRRRALERIDLFNESWPSGTDWELLLRLSQRCTFAYINAPLVIQRRTPDATHQRFRIQDKEFLVSVFLREKAMLLSDSEALMAINRGLAALYNSLAWAYFENGSWGGSLSKYWTGFRETDSGTLLWKIASLPAKMASVGIRRATVR